MILAALIQTVAIFTMKVDGVKPWDPDSISAGVTGSEEAVIYVSQKLAHQGLSVRVFADVPTSSPHSLSEANPRFVPLDFEDGTFFDVAIAWRNPKIANSLKGRARKVYFWPHDLCDMHLTEEEILGFDDVLWLSNSQREQWSFVNPLFGRFTKIFGNGINPEQFREVEERSNPYSCIYGSSYDRGLAVLLDCWPVVKREFPRATLDIYYGLQSLRRMEPLKELKIRAQIASLSWLDVREHGLVSHEELTRAYEKASFWTYPCTLLPIETFCISALKAQFAGAVPVIIDGSALRETVKYGYRCTQAHEYVETLLEAMRGADSISLEQRKQQQKFILKKYTWEKIASQWKNLFIEQAL